MPGILLVILSISINWHCIQGQQSSLEEGKLAEKLDFENHADGTSLSEENFIAGEKLKNIPALEDYKKRMYLTLTSKNEWRDDDDDDADDARERTIEREISTRWPNAVVPYVVEEVFTDDDKAEIASAIKNIEDNSCVTFRPAVAADLDWVKIFTTNASGCTGHRYYGPAYGEHELNLEGDSGDGLTCINRGVIIHELLHMLGFSHEHQRPDRDTMVTVNWTNIKVDKIHNMFRDSWDTEDLTAVPICNSTGAEQATADFSGCVSGDVMTAYGQPYDFFSVMHYEFDSFAFDPSVFTMTPFNSSVTSPGNVELSPLDIIKLQKAYGCDSCGGYQRSPVGGEISGNGASDLMSPCEWVLETDEGSGILVDMRVLAGGSCDTDYIEIRIGRSSDDPLVGKYCPDNLPTDPIRVDSNTVWVKWGKSNMESQMDITWSVYEVTCCRSVMLENMPNLPSMTFMMTPTLAGGRPLYKLTDGLVTIYYLFLYSAYGWFVGEDPATTTIISANKGQNICPEASRVPWEVVKNGELVEQENVTLRCSNCTMDPSYPECEECCDQVTLISTFNEFHDPRQYYSQFYGNFSFIGSTHNNRKIYKSDDFNKMCIFYNDNGKWVIYFCPGENGSDLNTLKAFMWAPGTKCVHQATGWKIYSQETGENVVDESFAFPCPGATSPAISSGTTTTTTKTSATTTTRSTTPITTTTSTTTTTPSVENLTPTSGCLPCKVVQGGSMMGEYFLEDTTTADPRCVDGCLYSKGEDLYCFAQGEDFVKQCE